MIGISQGMTLYGNNVADGGIFF